MASGSRCSVLRHELPAAQWHHAPLRAAGRLLVYQDFDRFEAAKRLLRFETGIVRYGAKTGPKPPPNYGATRYVRIGGPNPADPPAFSYFHIG